MTKKKDKEFSLDLWGTNYELRKTLLEIATTEDGDQVKNILRIILFGITTTSGWM